MQTPYFHQFEDRLPPRSGIFSRRRAALWHVLAGIAVGLGVWYLHWRWTGSLNTDALWFSIPVAAAETLCFLGTLLFFHDIWDEDDTPPGAAPRTRADLGLADDGPIQVDIFITTCDEAPELVTPSLLAARAVSPPEGVKLSVHLLDDGDRPDFRALAGAHDARYHSRSDNRGFKAGNLRNALFASKGDIVVICDADTRVLPGILQNTLGYFRDPRVAWVQTPHWFYDIPPGRRWADWLEQRLHRRMRILAPFLIWLSGHDQVGRDPFMSDPALFFDVIQRRRNRNSASFCCGAGSIHRREALFDNALKRQAENLARLSTAAPGDRRHTAMRRLLPRMEMEPFRYHVSEDIHTSIHQHCDGWRSVYHPQVEARMLSPWSMKAWKTQQLKYAGGTFDIMLRANPLGRSGMAWRTKLHYAATFWAYLAILWVPVLMLAPVFSLFTGIAPVDAYSTEFFLHILPPLILGEAALLVGCKGHDINPGRVLAVSLLPLKWRAFWQVARGERPRFPPTPKTLILSQTLRHVRLNLLLFALMIAAGIHGIVQYAAGSPDHSLPFLVVNLFWLLWIMVGVGRVLLAARWRPADTISGAWSLYQYRGAAE